MDAHGPNELSSRQFVTEFGNRAITCVSQQIAKFDSALQNTVNFVECYSPFRLEDDFQRYLCGLPTLGIVGPLFGHVKLKCQWHWYFIARKCNGNEHLTIRLFAQLTAVLVCHSYRMFPLFHKWRIVDDEIRVTAAESIDENARSRRSNRYKHLTCNVDFDPHSRSFSYSHFHVDGDGTANANYDSFTHGDTHFLPHGDRGSWRIDAPNSRRIIPNGRDGRRTGR